MYANTGPGDGSGSNKFVRSNSNGELLDGRYAEQQSEVVVDDNDKTFTVPASTEWELISAFVTVVTMATAGNRQLVIELQDGSSNVIGQIRVGAVQAASLTRYYQFGVGLSDLTAFRDTDYLTTPLPENLFLPAGYKVRFYDKANVAATDDILIRMMVRKRLVP